MATTPYTPGQFVWREIFTNDVAATRAFYSALVGWTVKEGKAAGRPYTMFYAGDMPVAGIMSLQDLGMRGVPPHWLGYVSVPDIAEAAAAVESGGGKVLYGPTDIGIGTFLVAQDPQCAVVAAWRSVDGDAPGGMPPMGSFCWESLGTTDVAAAKRFYASLFAWDARPMGPEMSVFHAGENMAASLNPAPEGTPAAWLSYILVPELGAARAKATKLGAKVLMDEVAVPGIGRFAVLTDPVGAWVAIFEGQQA